MLKKTVVLSDFSFALLNSEMDRISYIDLHSILETNVLLKYKFSWGFFGVFNYYFILFLCEHSSKTGPSL